MRRYLRIGEVVRAEFAKAERQHLSWADLVSTRTGIDPDTGATVANVFCCRPPPNKLPFSSLTGSSNAV
jgi:hypothetical protein